ncbi:MAG TPA: response regulator, partial [Burkholderiales bacterium]|nr:response regulator [Burkholderiales bacterium]
MSTDKRALVLLVDDSEDMLALMHNALASDYEVISAADAGTAIEKASSEPRPDLILLDIEMPEIDGFEVCRALKGEAATIGIPIIFLTGKTEAQAQLEALELGAADFITKSSSNAAVLRARVRMHLALTNRQ